MSRSVYNFDYRASAAAVAAAAVATLRVRSVRFTHFGSPLPPLRSTYCLQSVNEFVIEIFTRNFAHITGRAIYLLLIYIYFFIYIRA